MDSDCLITYRCFFPNALLVPNMSQSIQKPVLVVLPLSQTCVEVVLNPYSKIFRKFPFSQKFFEKCSLILPELSQSCPRDVLEFPEIVKVVQNVSRCHPIYPQVTHIVIKLCPSFPRVASDLKKSFPTVMLELSQRCPKTVNCQTAVKNCFFLLFKSCLQVHRSV